MLVIRKEQIEVLREHRLKQFEDRVAAHLRELFPEETAGMDDERLRLYVRGGVVRAEKYDIIEEDNVEKYLEFMMVYGQDFDVEEETRWAREILNNSLLNSFEKIDELEMHAAFASMEDAA
ncbi:MAG: hypothetical protein ACRD68_17925 [Pyrinomonadaceae bacterium]